MDVNYYLEQGLKCRDKGEYHTAINYFKEALRYVPDFDMLDFVDVHILLADAYIKANQDYTEAIKCCDNALRYKPDFTKAHLLKAQAYIDGFQDYQKAIGCYYNIIEYKPDYEKAHFAIGKALMDGFQDYMTARACFEMATKCKQDFAEAHFLKGHCYILYKNETNKAIDCYKNAARLGLGDAQALLKTLGVDW